MKTVKMIAPEGQSNAGETVEIPEADAKSFEENGWKRADTKNPK